MTQWRKKVEDGRHILMQITTLFFFIDPDGMLTQSFIDKLLSSASGTTWTNNNNGTFTSNEGEKTSTGEEGANVDQEDPKTPKKTTPEQENEKWRKYNESQIPFAKN